MSEGSSTRNINKLTRLANALPSPLLRLSWALRHGGLFSDLASLRAYCRLVPQTSGSSSNRETITVHIRQLQGHPISLRPHGTDAEVIYTTFGSQFHLPPTGIIPPNDALIFDLGSNIGCTIAHFAHVFSGATVIGVELDTANAELARHNTVPWEERCEILTGAIWPTDGEVEYSDAETRQDAYRVGTITTNPAMLKSVPALSMNTLIAKYAPDRMIDYVKMDIEGAERQVLKENTEWMAHVRCIKVELHDYQKEECIADLRQLGLQTLADTNHWTTVIGIRS